MVISVENCIARMVSVRHFAGGEKRAPSHRADPVKEPGARLL